MKVRFPDDLKSLPIEQIISRYKGTTNHRAVPEYEKVLFDRLSKYALAIQTRMKDTRMLKASDSEKLKRAKLEDNTEFYKENRGRG